ncbi:MAG: AmmeMemoRadiSam system protein A [Candidatus Aminicenantaceae bacterium]
MSPSLNTDQKRFLLKLARDAITHYLDTGKYLKIEAGDSVLEEKRGAFVTLKEDGRLKGCIGYPMPQKPLVDTVIETAAAAATDDPRFQPLTVKDLPKITIEISVLSQPRRIRSPHEVEVGKHGIIISRGPYRGLLLPQVPIEWNWDRETFLRQGCLKAGLDENAWQQEAQIEVFTAEVFAEE